MEESKASQKSKRKKIIRRRTITSKDSNPQDLASSNIVKTVKQLKKQKSFQLGDKSPMQNGNKLKSKTRVDISSKQSERNGTNKPNKTSAENSTREETTERGETKKKKKFVIGVPNNYDKMKRTRDKTRKERDPNQIL